ncbi:MAG: inositol monophosphatase [Planctomycetales bacterium]|nr:inositol monophosphatase [Planctomycetales bacterium]
MQEFAETCEKAARVGGAVLHAWRGRFATREKGPSDLVTDADLDSQRTIAALLLSAFPDHQFIGEEAEVSEEGLREFCWIVDPLDGTTNYVHGIPHYSTSVALVRHKKLLVGSIYDPCRDECFTAVAGAGAYLNGRPLNSSKVKDLRNALVSASFPANSVEAMPRIDEFLRVLPACQSLQRTGSAALNLAYVAAGRYDAYWASDLKPWDAAAGALLVQEAGGVITDDAGNSFDVWRPKLIAAANAELHTEFHNVIRSL